MKVIVSIQAKGTSSRGLVHYVAHSKLDAARETAGREIFNEKADEISVEKANALLNDEITGKRPSNEELHHLVISLKPEDYERLGVDENERQKSFKEIIRQTMKKFENEISADKLNWAAGIHRNTDNPHVHIAINKTYFDKNLEKKILSKLPSELLPHYEKNGAGEKTFAPGCLIESATEKLDEILQEKETKRELQKKQSKDNLRQNRTDEKTHKGNQKMMEVADNSGSKSKTENQNERDILAQAILAKYYLEKSRENLDSLVNHGDKRRFKIFDAISGKKRAISLFDLERRSEKRADKNIKKRNISDSVKKEELRKTFVEDELQKNIDGIKRIKTILHNLVVKETGELRKREDEYKIVKPLAEKIRQNYRKENKQLPIPNLTPEDLEMLQTEALEKKEFRAANYFEKVRLELARERNTSTRTTEQLQKLKAKQTLSELKVLHQEKQLRIFNEGKRHFAIELEGKKLTLARIDELIEKRAVDEQKLTAKIGKVLGKIGLIERKDERAKLEETRNLIVEKLGEKQENSVSEITRENSLLKTLGGFYQKDTNPEKETLEPKFSANELAEIESLACSLKLPEVFRENWLLQKEFIEGSEDKDKNTSEAKEKIIAGRALARQVLSEIELAQCKEELQNFKKHKDFTKFEIVKEKTGEAKFVSLSEVRFDSRGSLFDQTLEYFLENREKRNTRRQLEKLVKEKHIELRENLRDAKSITKTAAEEARDFQTKSIFGTVKFTQEPLFTPKELMTIELRINQTESKSEAKSLQKILDSADHSKAKNLSAILSGSLVETEHSKKAETSQNKANLPEKIEVKLSSEKSDIRENKLEIFNQERGR